MIFGAGAFIFKAFPFFNYYFVLKGFGTAMWVWTLYTAMNRWISGVVSRNEFMSQQKVANDVMEGKQFRRKWSFFGPHTVDLVIMTIML